VEARQEIDRADDGGGVLGHLHAAEQLLGGLEPGVGGIAHAHDLAVFHHAEIADVVRAPLAETDHADTHGRGGAAHWDEFSPPPPGVE